jgi:ankyrin repeat protein
MGKDVLQTIKNACEDPYSFDKKTKDTILHWLSENAQSIGNLQMNDIIQGLQDIVAQGVNLNWHNRDGHHPLSAFICNQKLRGSETGATLAKYIESLLWKDGKHGDRNFINVDMMNRRGATALYEAAIRAQSHSVRSLIEAGANVNARLSRRDTHPLPICLTLTEYQ